MLILFVEKKCEQCKASLIFSTKKNISVFGYKVVKHLTSWPLNKLVKLRMLWTTGLTTINGVYRSSVTGFTFRRSISTGYKLVHQCSLPAVIVIFGFCRDCLWSLASFQDYCPQIKWLPAKTVHVNVLPALSSCAGPRSAIGRAPNS